MVVLMHYAAVAVIEAHGPRDVREAIAAGGTCHPGVLRGGFAQPLLGAARAPRRRTATAVRLDARKSWVTSAGEADSYVWSSRPLAEAGPMTLWLVPADAGGPARAGAFDGLGLRGNGSSPVTAEGVARARRAELGADGAGLDIALRLVLPTVPRAERGVRSG